MYNEDYVINPNQLSSDSDLGNEVGLDEKPEKIELDLKHAFFNSVLKDVNVDTQMKSDLVSYNNIEKKKENI